MIPYTENAVVWKSASYKTY